MKLRILLTPARLRMSASMDAYLNGYADPRRTVYFTKADDGNYHGVRQGILTANTWTPYTGTKISNLNMNTSSTQIVWMTAAESYFLRAEGALRGWNMGGTGTGFLQPGYQPLHLWKMDCRRVTLHSLCRQQYISACCVY
jgi:hypothetical protein